MIKEGIEFTAGIIPNRSCLDLTPSVVFNAKRPPLPTFVYLIMVLEDGLIASSGLSMSLRY